MLVGANAITSLTDETEEARTINRVYESALRSVLSECKWNFATKRALLTLTTDELDWYFTGEVYVYNKPSDMVRIFDTSYRYAMWREEGGYIISDTASLGVLYVYYLDTPSSYSSAFIEALIDKLCIEIAYRIVNSASLADKFRLVYKDSIGRATAENSQVGNQQTPIDDAWEQAKYSDSHPDA
jgi:hypothetical protein